MSDTLPYSHQSIDESDLADVAEALRSDFLTTGPRVEQFESALRSRLGTPHVAALSSGTAALHAALAALGVGPGDEIVTSPLTFAATGNAALYLGARPVFVDVEPSTGTIDPAAIEDGISPRTRAIVAIDYAGMPADYDAIRAVADRHGLPVVADAAHSLGATYHGRAVGTLADLTTLSFHPVKHITTGEGGAVASADSTLHQAILEFRSHGLVRDPGRLTKDEGPWYYEMQSLGFNYRITDIQCALGISQLRRLDEFLGRRRWIADRYDEVLRTIPSLETPVRVPGFESAWHLYVVRTRDRRRRRALFETLRAAGLGVQVHYIPVYLHPYYRDLGYPPGLCPIAEDFYAGAISIPIFPAMSDADVVRVSEVVAKSAERALG